MALSNYPPGVSGHEPHISGGGWTDYTDTRTCPECDWTGMVTVEEAIDGPEIIEEWMCGGCDTAHQSHRDNEPDPDIAHDRAAEGWDE